MQGKDGSQPVFIGIIHEDFNIGGNKGQPDGAPYFFVVTKNSVAIMHDLR